MMKIYTRFLKTSVGELLVGCYNDQVCLCDWRYRKKREQIDTRIKSLLAAEYSFEPHPLFSVLENQLNGYLVCKRKAFDLPLLMVGTDFQQKVWNALLEIPYGETSTYLGLSERMGDTKAIRAVAAANGANAISIIVPCHRVIGSKRELIGYAGGLQAKKKLLDLEGAFNDGQLSLF